MLHLALFGLDTAVQVSCCTTKVKFEDEGLALSPAIPQRQLVASANQVVIGQAPETCQQGLQGRVNVP